MTRLATFPEQNPNPVIEVDGAGAVAYMNPAAMAAFPEMAVTGGSHPLIDGVSEILARLLASGEAYVEREVDLGGTVVEQRICRVPNGSQPYARIYAHDVTERQRAERRIHELARRLFLAQEEERRRVALELHDEAGQALVALKIALQLLADDPRENVDSTLREAITLVDSTREQIRLLAHGLRPPALDAVGLSQAMSDYCKDFGRRTGLEISYHGSEVARGGGPVDMCLYRVLQEALTNVARHAMAARVQVTLEQRTGWITLTVEDDGRGLGPESDSAGLGITGMSERVDLLSGRFEISSETGGGTRLIATLPLVAS